MGAGSPAVHLQLQADCFAGLWARQADERFGLLESGDMEEAMNPASRIDGDALQRRSRGVVVPDSFTRGTSEQRAGWFMRGFEAGRRRATSSPPRRSADPQGDLPFLAPRPRVPQQAPPALPAISTAAGPH